MNKSPVDATALAAAAIAVAAGALLLSTPFAFLGSVAGLVLLILLLSYDEEGYRSIVQSLAYAGVCALCLALAAVIPYQYVYGMPTPHEPQLVNKWLPLTWVFGWLLFSVIDRARMSGRTTANVLPGAATLGSVLSPPPAVRATPVQPASSPVIDVPPPGQPPTPHLVRDETPISAPAPPPPPAPVLTEIYVHITGESLNMMRTVQAEHVGRDYYRIVDTMPENEMWQFTPGMVVRCRKQNLSTGKALVAFEEAKRAQ